MSKERRKLIASSLYDGIEGSRIRYVLAILQDEDADPNYILNDRGIAPIHLAIGHENKSFALEVTSVLLQYGADPNICSVEGLTPVHIASMWGRARLLRLLLCNGGNPWLEDDEGKNAFHFAFEESHSATTQVLENFRRKDLCKFDDWAELCDPNPKYTIALDKVLLFNQEVLMSYQASVPFAARQCRSAGTQTSPEPAAPAPVPRPAAPSPASASALDRFNFVLSDIRNKVVSQVTLRKVSKRPLARRPNLPPAAANGLSFLDELQQRLSAGLRHRPTQTSPPASPETRLVDDEAMVLVTPCSESGPGPAPAAQAEGDGAGEASTRRSSDEFESRLDRAFYELEADGSDEWAEPAFGGDAADLSAAVAAGAIPQLDLRGLAADIAAASAREDEDAFVHDMNACSSSDLHDSGDDASAAESPVASSATIGRSHDSIPCGTDNALLGITKNASQGGNYAASDGTTDLAPVERQEAVPCETNTLGGKNSNVQHDAIPNGMNSTSHEMNSTSHEMNSTSHEMNNMSREVNSRTSSDFHSSIPYGTNNTSFGTTKNGPRGSMHRTSLAESRRGAQPSAGPADSGGDVDVARPGPGSESCPMVTARSQLTERNDGARREPAESMPPDGASAEASARRRSTRLDDSALESSGANYQECHVVWENSGGGAVADASSEFFSCRDDAVFLVAAAQDQASTTDLVQHSLVSIPAASQVSYELISEDEGSFGSDRPDSMLMASNDGQPPPNEATENNGQDVNTAKAGCGRFSWASECDSFVSASEEYVYTDEEAGVALVERRFLVPPASAEGSSADGSVVSDGYDTDGLRAELRKHGIEPGPIVPSTKRVYLKKLQRVARHKADDDDDQPLGYSCELDRSLRDSDLALDLARYEDLEREMSAQFAAPDPRKWWRGGVLKSSFCYLLLDPRVTANLPCRAAATPPRQAWATFLEAIFYVGKGQRSRPYSHLYQAVAAWRSGARAADGKTRHIVDVWSAGLGVVCLHVFQNVIPAEAHTREAAMLDALTLGRVRNARRSEYYGVAAAWPARQRNLLGTLLLHKAMRIFLSEGERQLRPDSHFLRSSFPPPGTPHER